MTRGRQSSPPPISTWFFHIIHACFEISLRSQSCDLFYHPCRSCLRTQQGWVSRIISMIFYSYTFLDIFSYSYSCLLLVTSCLLCCCCCFLLLLVVNVDFLFCLLHKRMSLAQETVSHRRVRRDCNPAHWWKNQRGKMNNSLFSFERHLRQ